MDEGCIETEAREYVEQVARNAHQDRESIPPEAFERAVKTAASSARELRAAVKLAQQSRRSPE